MVRNSVKYQNFCNSRLPRDHLYLVQPKKAAFESQKWKYRTIFHKKVSFWAVFEGQFWANYRNYLELPKKNHLKPHTFLKIHTLTSSKMLKLVWFYLGNSKKSWLSFSSRPVRKWCLSHPRKTPKSSIFFFFKVQHSNKGTVIFDKIWKPQLDKIHMFQPMYSKYLRILSDRKRLFLTFSERKTPKMALFCNFFSFSKILGIFP